MQDITAVKAGLKNLNSCRDKLKSLHNIHKGETCYILGCGPSLKDYAIEEIEEVLRDNPTIAIKQAFFTNPALIDYHIINDNNLMEYPHRDFMDSVIRLVSCRHEETAKQISQLAEWDVFTPIEQDTDFSQALCNTLDFDKYTFDNQYERPWGPGLMGELVFFFAYHLGFKNIITLGWDHEQPGTTTSHHFYDHALSSDELVNPANKMLPDEIAKNINMSREWYLWLKERDVNLSTISKNSHIHEIIPRLTL